MTYEYKQYLAHHGIKGQKWGHRRYQNDDGSLTEEGRQHYGVGDGDAPIRLDPEKQQEAKQRKDKIIKAALGVTMAAAALYLGSTKLRNNYRKIFDRVAYIGKGNALSNDRYRALSRSLNRRQALLLKGKELKTSARNFMQDRIDQRDRKLYDSVRRRYL